MRKDAPQPSSSEFADPPDLLLVRPTNHAFIEGAKRQSYFPSGTKDPTVFIVISFMIAIILVPTFILLASKILPIFIFGKTTEGIITNAKTNNIGTGYHVTYYFVVPDENEAGYSEEVEVNKEMYERLQSGSKVQIIYSSRNPNNSNIAGNSRALEVLLFWGALTIIDVAIFLLLIRPKYRRYRLFKRGQLPQVLVDSSTVQEGKPSVTQLANLPNLVIFNQKNWKLIDGKPHRWLTLQTLGGLVVALGLLALLIMATFSEFKNPNENSDNSALLFLWLWWGIPACFAFLAVLRERNLSRNGQLLQGEVVWWNVEEISWTKKYLFPSKSGPSYDWIMDVQVQFYTPDGELIQAKKRFTSKDTPRLALLPTRTTYPIAVLYVDRGIYEIL